MMRIYTSSWSTKLPEGFARIGISRGAPRRSAAGYRMYRRLAPGSWFNSVSAEEYRRRYMEQLGALTAQQVGDEIAVLAGDKTPALLCFEPPAPGPKWCHRAYVSVWLETELGFKLLEYGQEKEGHGWAHPKLPPEYRLAPVAA